MDDFLTVVEHKEFCRRVDEENARQNKRLSALEESTKQITNLVISVERLANNMEQMAREQREQNDKLEKLEGRDGEKWRSVVSYITVTIVGIVLGFVFQQIGI